MEAGRFKNFKWLERFLVMAEWPTVPKWDDNTIADGTDMNAPATALEERTDLLKNEKADKNDIVQGQYSFATLAAFDAAKATIPVNSTVIIDEAGPNQGTNTWNGTSLSKSPYDPQTQAQNYTDSKVGTLLTATAVDVSQLTNIITGSYINTSGNQTASANWSCSNFIEVDTFDRLIYSATANNVVAFVAAYNASKVFLRDLMPVSGSTLTVKTGNLNIPSDTKFIRVTFYSANSTAHSFSILPYVIDTDRLDTNGLTDKVWDNVTTPLNLFDSSTAKSGYSLVNNVETGNTNWIVSDYIPVVGSGTYVTNGSGFKDATTNTGIHYYGDNKVFLSYGIAQTKDVAFTVPAGAKFMRINYVKTTSPTIDRIVVNKGTQAIENGRLELKIQEVVNQLSVGSRYAGLTWMPFGDSITDHYETDFTYPPLVAAYFGMTLIDVAKSGSRVRSSFFSRSALTTNANILASHIFTIAHGTNDFKLETPLGVITDTPTARATLDDAAYNSTTNTTGTFCADYKGVIESILTINPNARIMLITPIRRTQTPGEGANSLGHTLLDYVNAIKDIAKLYSLPILDNHSSSGFNLKTIPAWTSDGLHPTKWAQENVMAPKVIGFIGSN